MCFQNTLQRGPSLPQQFVSGILKVIMGIGMLWGLTKVLPGRKKLGAPISIMPPAIIRSPIAPASSEHSGLRSGREPSGPARESKAGSDVTGNWEHGESAMSFESRHLRRFSEQWKRSGRCRKRIQTAGALSGVGAKSDSVSSVTSLDSNGAPRMVKFSGQEQHDREGGAEARSLSWGHHAQRNEERNLHAGDEEQAGIRRVVADAKLSTSRAKRKKKEKAVKAKRANRSGREVHETPQAEPDLEGGKIGEAIVTPSGRCHTGAAEGRFNTQVGAQGINDDRNCYSWYYCVPGKTMKYGVKTMMICARELQSIFSAWSKDGQPDGTISFCEECTDLKDWGKCTRTDRTHPKSKYVAKPRDHDGGTSYGLHKVTGTGSRLKKADYYVSVYRGNPPPKFKAYSEHFSRNPRNCDKIDAGGKREHD